jgi:thiosulfate reductase cytochrome b subunit
MGRRAFALLLAWLGAVAGTARADTEDCLECHVDLRVEEGKTPLFTRRDYQTGVHATSECIACHYASDSEGFDVVPHRIASGGPPDCLECHRHDFEERIEEYRRSVHAQRMPETFGCVRCHDPHTMRRKEAAKSRAEHLERNNRACLHCHRDAEFRVAAKHGEAPPATTHDWLPSLDKHARMSCVVCHTPISGKDDHEIQAKEKATRSCEACHGTRAPLIEKYVGKDDRSGWITNPVVFHEAYLPGTVRNRAVDAAVLALFALAVIGALVHGALRLLVGRRRPEPAFVVERTYLYAASVRLWHWTNAVLMILLAATGLRVHFGGREDPILSFETAFHIHNFAGALLVLLGVAYFVNNAGTRNQRQYLSRPRDGLAGLWNQARFYLVGIFRGEAHPYHASEERKFNPLQQVTYAGIMYLVFPLLALTGIVLLFPRMVPEKILGLPGVWWFATAHYLCAAALVVFLLIHLYLATMGDRIGYLLSAMITGWHKHHVEQNEAPEDEAEALPTDS